MGPEQAAVPGETSQIAFLSCDAVDFKKAQYKFAKASEEEKSEILKDILGFANAYRRSPAYILIGVEEKPGDRASVIGIAQNDHLADHALQQFVNNLTNQPVSFQYQSYCHEGSQIGVIRIEIQRRPLYLKKDYGKLKQGSVYVRRGSSTDPTKPATPDEIAHMGGSTESQIAELTVEFGDLMSDKSLGVSNTIITEHLSLPDEIPDLPETNTRDFGNSPYRVVASSAFEQHNSQYYRELAMYEYCRRCYKPLRLIVTAGNVAAKNVRIEIDVPSLEGINFLRESDLPEMPTKVTNNLSMPGINRMHDMLRKTPGEVTIARDEHRIKIEIDCKDIQPGRSVRTDVFLVALRSSAEYTIVGRLFADNLPTPIHFELLIIGKVKDSALTVNQLLTMAKRPH